MTDPWRRSNATNSHIIGSASVPREPNKDGPEDLLGSKPCEISERVEGSNKEVGPLTIEEESLNNLDLASRGESSYSF